MTHARPLGAGFRVDTFKEKQYYYGSPALDSSDEKYGAVILTDKHKSFQEHVFALLELTGKVPDDTVALLLIPYKKKTIAQELADFRAGFPNSYILFDQSGAASDSLVGKNEIEVGKVPSRVDGKSIYTAIPHFSECKLSEGAEAYIRDAVQNGLLNTVDDAMRPQASESYVGLRPAQTEEIIRGITFDHCSSHLPSSFSQKYIEMLYCRESVELVLGGYVNADDSFLELARCASVFCDCFYIWTETMVNLGCPVVFAPAHTTSRMSIKASGIKAIGEGLGIDSMIDAYFEGVPITDILA